MKDQRITNGTPSIRRSCWLKAVLITAAVAALSISIIPGEKTEKAQPQAIFRPATQMVAQTAPQPQPQQKGTPQIRNQAVAKAASGADGMMAFIDPETGQIREPEAWEAEQLARTQAEAAKQRALTLRGGRRERRATLYHPSGAVGMEVGEDQMSYSIASVNSDGTLSMDCLPGRQAAEKRVKSSAKHPAPIGKEKLDEK
jgi:hypothetical protein